jgi:hypothetical protein
MHLTQNTAAPPQKAKTPSDSGAQGSQVVTLNKVNSATDAAHWEYRVLEASGRFLVLSPLGLAIEDCASAIAASRLANARNARMGMGVSHGI